MILKAVIIDVEVLNCAVDVPFRFVIILTIFVVLLIANKLFCSPS